MDSQRILDAFKDIDIQPDSCACIIISTAKMEKLKAGVETANTYVHSMFSGIDIYADERMEENKFVSLTGEQLRYFQAVAKSSTQMGKPCTWIDIVVNAINKKPATDQQL